jgi:uncharacterized caspase-like protein
MLALLALLACLPVVQDRGTGLQSPPEPAVAYQRRHAVVIGIDEYGEDYQVLSNAVADARAVRKTLVERYGFATEDVRLILNEEATKSALEEALDDWLTDPARVGPHDLVVVFFAGHGITRPLPEGVQRGYLAPVDASRTEMRDPKWSSLIAMRDLDQLSEAIPAKHVVVLLDCCFGGLVTRSDPPNVAGMTNRARQVLTAGDAGQPVVDSDGGGHSVFTRALIDALEGAGDLNGDEVLTFFELYDFVSRRVESRTDRRQTPIQATLAFHDGGSAAFFHPAIGAEERGKAVERVTHALRVHVEDAELIDLVSAIPLAEPIRDPFEPADYRLFEAGGALVLETIEGLSIAHCTAATLDRAFEHEARFRTYVRLSARRGRRTLEAAFSEWSDADRDRWGGERVPARLIHNSESRGLWSARAAWPSPEVDMVAIVVELKNPHAVPQFAVVVSIEEGRAVNRIWPPPGQDMSAIAPEATLRVPVLLPRDDRWTLRRASRDRYVVISSDEPIDVPFVSSAAARVRGSWESSLEELLASSSLRTLDLLIEYP